MEQFWVWDNVTNDKLRLFRGINHHVIRRSADEAVGASSKIQFNWSTMKPQLGMESSVSHFLSWLEPIKKSMGIWLRRFGRFLISLPNAFQSIFRDGLSHGSDYVVYVANVATQSGKTRCAFSWSLSRCATPSKLSPKISRKWFHFASAQYLSFAIKSSSTSPPAGIQLCRI